MLNPIEQAKDKVMSSIDKAIGASSKAIRASNYVLDDDKVMLTKDETIERIEKLEMMIDNHDCKADENHGCDCSFWKEELRELTGKPKSIIQ